MLSKYDEIYEEIKNVEDILESLFISGFSSYNEFTLKSIDLSINNCEKIGLNYASKELKNIFNLLDKKNHSFNFNFSECIDRFCKLKEYCSICKKRLEVLQVREKL